MNLGALEARIKNYSIINLLTNDLLINYWLPDSLQSGFIFWSTIPTTKLIKRHRYLLDETNYNYFQKVNMPIYSKLQFLQFFMCAE